MKLTDAMILKELSNSINLATINDALSFADINRMGLEVDEYRANHESPISEPKIDLDLTKFLKRKRKRSNLKNYQNIWLKPVWYSEEPMKEGTVFAKLREELYFSKRRPSGIRQGDIIIVYGVGTTKLVGIFTVTSEPIYTSENEIDDDDEWKKRWPWYVRAVNNSPQFSSTWWTHKLFINELVNDYLKEYEYEKPITRAGGQTLGALNFGLDKVALAHHFGLYLIGIIESLNAALSTD